MTAPLLAARDLVRIFRTGGLTRRRGEVRAVDGVSLTIRRGETLGLVGESGSGKTTLGRLLLGLLRPTAGVVRFDGVSVHGAAPGALRALRRRMQIVFQDPSGSLNPRMTAGAAVAEPLVVHRLAPAGEARARVTALFQEVGLDPALADHYPHELSAGQRQRVGIARALAVSPELLVLDEPVSALDVSIQAQVLNLLADLRDRRGLTYLFIAHDLAVVRHLADRMAVMYRGTLVEVAPADDLCTTPSHPYTRTLLAAVPAPVPGHLPAVLAPPADATAHWHATGCAFAPRCPHPEKNERCRTEVPGLRETAPGRWVGCHYEGVKE